MNSKSISKDRNDLGVPLPQNDIDFTKYNKNKKTNTQITLSTCYMKDMYDITIIPLLEKYLEEQVANKTFDLDANIHLLRNYKIYPEKINLKKVVHILVKCLMNLSNKGYIAVVYLIPESIIKNEMIQKIKKSGSFLESCQFELFWNTEYDFASDVPSFEESIRSYILAAIRSTYKKLPKQFILKQLNINENRLKLILQEKKWKLVGDYVEVNHEVESIPENSSLSKIFDGMKLLDIIRCLSNQSKTNY